MKVKKNKSNASWIHRHMNDPYVKMAQARGYRARAAFKLLEIDERDKLMKPGQIIVDLGSTPGSWCQVAREKLVGPGGVLRGRIIALDVLPMDPVADVTFILGDFREDAIGAQLNATVGAAPGERTVDLVLSDMAPNLSGVGLADAARIEHVGELALEFALRHLKPEGALLIKSFHGTGFSQMIERFKRVFVTVAERKPKASRDESSETFILGRRIKPAILEMVAQGESPL